MLRPAEAPSTRRPPSQRGWRRALYRTTRINLGPSQDEIDEANLHARIRRDTGRTHQIGVLGLKGGVGRTVVTSALGSLFSAVRGDRVLAVDADPNAGNLADRSGRRSLATLATLLANREFTRYDDVRVYTHTNRSNLQVVAADEYSGARGEFGDREWQGAVEIASRHYNLVLADCGPGLFHPASRAVLSTVASLVIVASASVDGARQAAVTLDWLRRNGSPQLLGMSCVVINRLTPKASVDVDDLVQQFERHVPTGRVIVLPYDAHVASGEEIDLAATSRAFRRGLTELAAALSDDFGRR